MLAAVSTVEMELASGTITADIEIVPLTLQDFVIDHSRLFADTYDEIQITGFAIVSGS